MFSNLLLAGGALFWLLVFTNLVDQEFGSATGAVTRYGPAAVIAILFFSSLLLPSTVRQNLALLLASITIALLAAEAILGIQRPKDTTLWTPSTKQQIDRLARLARQFGVEYDTRTHLQVVSDFRSQGIDAVPPLYPHGLFAQQPDGSLKSQIEINDSEVLPLSGISGKLTVFCNEAGQWITYQSDEHGFNNPPGIWNLPVLDIAVLGDSYAHGACVPADRNFVALIRGHYPATLNLGNSNTGPLMSLAALKEYAASYRPKVVLWFLYPQNDLNGLDRENKSPLLRRYLRPRFAQGLPQLRAELDRALERQWVGSLEEVQSDWPDQEDTFIPAIMQFKNLQRTVVLARRPGHLEPSIDSLTQVVSEAKSAVESWGGRLYLVYLPERDRYAQPRVASLDDARRKRVLSMARSLRVELIDIHRAFEASGDSLGLFPFRRRGHYNEKGHRLVAKTVLQAIAAQHPPPNAGAAE